MKKRLSLAVLLCFLPSAIEAFTQEQEQVLASRWNTSWLTCDLVEILIATAGRYYSFKLNDSEVIQLSVNWEQHQPTSTFEKKIPKIGTFAKISPEQRAGFVSALTYDYDQREQILARVIQDICTTEKEKRQVFSKVLSLITSTLVVEVL